MCHQRESFCQYSDADTLLFSMGHGWYIQCANQQTHKNNNRKNQGDPATVCTGGKKSDCWISVQFCINNRLNGSPKRAWQNSQVLRITSFLWSVLPAKSRIFRGWLRGRGLGTSPKTSIVILLLELHLCRPSWSPQQCVKLWEGHHEFGCAPQNKQNPVSFRNSASSVPASVYFWAGLCD